MLVVFLFAFPTWQVRVVKSAKDRSFEAIRTAVGRIRNHIKINDWNGIQADLDECNKHVDKSKVPHECCSTNAKRLEGFYVRVPSCRRKPRHPLPYFVLDDGMFE